jgi:hypothetical protein
VIDRPKEPPKPEDEADLDPFGSERPTAPGEVPDERPTVSPPFDVEAYAKASDSKVRAVRSSPLPADDASTKPPPVPDFDLTDQLPPVERARPQLSTLIDEDETEEARIRSVLMPSNPPPRKRSGPPPDEEAPPTVAYPAEYEKDPFARLNAPAAAMESPARSVKDMRDRFSLGDYTGALELAEAVLATDPANEVALTCADECRSKLIQMYAARIGPMDRVPVVMVATEQLRWLSIDHRAGFLLSHIDGVSNLEMILDVSGMPLLDALKILCELVQQRVITMR